MKTIQDQAAIVLQEIDAALALVEKEVAPEFVMPTGYVGLNNKGEHYRVGWHHGAAEYAAFIATSRTLLPASLRILRDFITDYLDDLQGAEEDGDTDTVRAIERRLTKAFTQWNENK